MAYRSQFDQHGLSDAALATFARFEELTGGTFDVNSAYRSPEHNAQVGGAKGSQHLHGNAFDISTAGLPRDEVVDLIRKGRAAGFSGVGVYDNALHFDVGPERAWGPSYSRDSLPAWAANALADVPVGTAPPAADAAPPRNALAALQGLPRPPQFQNALQYGFKMT